MLSFVPSICYYYYSTSRCLGHKSFVYYVLHYSVTKLVVNFVLYILTCALAFLTGTKKLIILLGVSV